MCQHRFRRSHQKYCHDIFCENDFTLDLKSPLKFLNHFQNTFIWGYLQSWIWKLIRLNWQKLTLFKGESPVHYDGREWKKSLQFKNLVKSTTIDKEWSNHHSGISVFFLSNFHLQIKWPLTPVLCQGCHTLLRSKSQKQYIMLIAE